MGGGGGGKIVYISRSKRFKRNNLIKNGKFVYNNLWYN